jgi:medium-chain acyl-[acyl-carrier-protein] hydrolase
MEVPRPKPRAQCRLFCLPYAGGSSVIYRPWQTAAPDFLEVVPLQLPGRGRRLKEPPLRNLLEIVDLITGDLLAMFREKPFAFFGHSMGAVISYEIVRKLRREHGLRPLALMVSGRQAPHLPDRDPATYQLPYDEFVRELHRLNGTPREILECAELMELMVPLLRADFEAIQTYEYQPEPPLDCPLHAFGGSEDADITPADIEAWGQHTSHEFTFKIFAGDHFFLQSQQEALLHDLVLELLRHRRSEFSRI